MLERDFLLTLEFDNEVVAYTTQPFSIKYSLDGGKRRYTPDILAKYRDNSFKSFEVKPLIKFEKPQNKIKFLALRDFFLQKLDHPLVLMSCANIYRGAQIENLKRLYPFRQQPIQVIEGSECPQIPNFLTCGMLQELLVDVTDSPYQCAMQFIAHQYFDWDVTKPLSNSTQLIKIGEIS